MANETNIRLDPTAIGLLLVAACMLPLAILDLWNDAKAFADIETVFTVAGIMLFVVTIWCWKCNANFGLCVFGLVALGVFATGWAYATGGTGAFFNIGLAVIFAVFLILSAMMGNPKLLTLIIAMTCLIFLFSGISVFVTDDWVAKVQGIFCIINFLACLWLGAGL